jgi:hypothetical protein
MSKGAPKAIYSCMSAPDSGTKTHVFLKLHKLNRLKYYFFTAATKLFDWVSTIYIITLTHYLKILFIILLKYFQVEQEPRLSIFNTRNSNEI